MIEVGSHIGLGSLNCGCLMEGLSMISVIIKGSLDEQIAINRELKLEIQSLQNQLIKVRQWREVSLR
jgi:hypothetical protein